MDILRTLAMGKSPVTMQHSMVETSPRSNRPVKESILVTKQPQGPTSPVTRKREGLSMEFTMLVLLTLPATMQHTMEQK